MQRLIAVNILSRVISNKQTLKESFDADEQFNLHQSKGFIAEVCFGVCRYYPQLQQLLSKLVKTPLKAKDVDIEILLLTGLYQLQYMDITDYAVINETVEVCRKLKKTWAKGLVNAILRAFCRTKESLYSDLSQGNSFRYALPQWFIDHMAPSNSDIENLGEALLQRAPIYLRVNSKKISSDDYQALLSEKNIEVEQVTSLPECLRLKQSIDIEELPGFADGYVSVQDIAPQHAISLLKLDSAHRVLDACSAPGGKLCHMLESLDREAQAAKVTALDISASRLNRIKENLNRLGLSARLVVGDGLDAKALFSGETFDRILLDAPCSASGVIRRHPDIKVLRTEADVKQITKTQSSLLESLWPFLAEGGFLLYCTCSLFDVENDKRIETFIKNNQDAKALEISLPIGMRTKHGIQCLPPEGDGFYYALLKKQ